MGNKTYIVANNTGRHFKTLNTQNERLSCSMVNTRIFASINDAIQKAMEMEAQVYERENGYQILIRSFVPTIKWN